MGINLILGFLENIIILNNPFIHKLNFFIKSNKKGKLSKTESDLDKYCRQ